MEFEVKGDKIVITLDVSDAALVAAEPSKSGKSIVVQSTRGFTRVGKFGLSLNLTSQPKTA